MPFKKNNSGNINGKPKGAINKTTKEIKEFVQNFVGSNLEQMQKDLEALEPKERLLFIEKLMKYVLPTQVNHEVDLTKTVNTVIRWGDKEIQI